MSAKQSTAWGKIRSPKSTATQGAVTGSPGGADERCDASACSRHARNAFVTRRTSFTRSVTASFRYKRWQCVWTVDGEMPRLTPMVNSVWSLNTPRTIWVSRSESLRRWAISSHALSENMLASARHDFSPEGAETNPNLSPLRTGNDLDFPIFTMLPFTPKPHSLLSYPRNHCHAWKGGGGCVSVQEFFESKTSR